MNILVTGSRAPAALDLMRALHSQGHKVFSADSMRYPLGRFSKSIVKHVILPAPNRNPQVYFDSLVHVIQENKIEYLIPVCEEVFFISRFYKELSDFCHLFLDPLEKLSALHNKYKFTQLCQNCQIKVPFTFLLKSNEDKDLIPNENIVLKPIFSRFGSFVLIKPNAKQIRELSLHVPYVAQVFIPGIEYCCYAIAHQGKLLTHAIYHPKYTAGSSAGIYFEPKKLESIDKFLYEFIEKIKFTGQISFDFINASDGLYVIECNPRATSGLHLIANQINWKKIFEGQPQEIEFFNKPKMLRLAMLLYGTKKIFSKNRKKFILDYSNATDVIQTSQDPWMELKLIFSFAEFFLKGIKLKKFFKNVTTDDIEWNGEEL